jgi:hypothetical protein
MSRIGLALALVGVVVVTEPGAAHAISTTKTEIQYIVSPHPDDVFEGWSLVQDSSANYPVFISLTKGESTGFCTNPGLTVPGYGTFDTTTVQGCKDARIASLNSWLDKQSDADAYLNDYVAGSGANMVRYDLTAPAGGTDTSGAPTVAGMTSCKPVWGSGTCTGSNPNVNTPIPDNLNAGASGPTVARQVTWWVGSTSARIVFDLGDGNLTDAEVVWAMNYVRANRATYLPLTNEYGIVAAAYANLGHEYTACDDYSHHDHRAVQEAVYNNDLISASGYHPQWGATCGSRTTGTGIDTDALPANGGRSNEITPQHYSENMANSSSYFQSSFNWLHGYSLWPSGPDPIYGGSGEGVLFAQWQYFWERFS